MYKLIKLKIKYHNLLKMIFYPLIIIGYVIYISSISAITIYVDDNYINN